VEEEEGEESMMMVVVVTLIGIDIAIEIDLGIEERPKQGLEKDWSGG